jgi:hypothetical protein
MFSSPEDAAPAWLLVLRAYLDESGHEGDGYVFLAGYLGNEDQWRNLASRWRAGLGQKKSFHAKKLRRSAATERLLARLGPIPEEVGLTPLFGGVKVSDYFDLVRGTNAEKFSKGFNMALCPLVLKTLHFVPKDERVEFFFEQQNEYEFGVNQLLGWLSQCSSRELVNADGKSKIARWGFVPKDSTILTQPADYLSYALTQVYRDAGSKKSEWCRPILASGEGVGMVMNRKEIRNIVRLSEKVSGGFDTLPALDEFKRMIQGQQQARSRTSGERQRTTT